MLFSKKKIRSILGIDIGTSSIKVVQLRRSEQRFKLETYGEISTFGYLERLSDAFQTTSLRTLEAVTRELLKILLDKIEATTKQAVMAVPIFSSFVSVMEMPEMAEKELSRAVEFEARRYVPIPLAEVMLDWKVIESGLIKDGISSQPFKGRRILLIAVPKEVVNKYIRLADILGFKISALELESFSVVRSLLTNDKGSACILDIGARATSFTIFDNGTVQMSHSLDTAGAEITKTLATGLGISSKRAEEFKLTYNQGEKLGQGIKDDVTELLYLSVDKIIDESERMIADYESRTNRKIEKIILNGGTACLSGLREYVEKKLNTKTFIADPWTQIIYPSALQASLKEIGPRFSGAIGAAMRQS